MRTKRYLAVIAAAVLVLAVAGPSPAEEKGHGSMSGMKPGEHMKMGDKIFEGMVGPWHGEVRLVDMKAQMEKAKASGMKMEGMMKKTHHISLHLLDPGTKKMLDVKEGKGAVTVAGPDKTPEKTDFVVMDGHFGADVNLPKPGKYTFNTEVESGGKKGSASFSYTER